MAQQGPAITTYGDRHEAAPEELDLFSFLIGKWEGSGKTRLPDGTIAEYDGLSWIGRYVSRRHGDYRPAHAPLADGGTGLGITIRSSTPTMTLGLSSFSTYPIRSSGGRWKPRSGAVEKDGSTVVVASVSDESISREYYRDGRTDSFVYTYDFVERRRWDVEQGFHRIRRESNRVNSHAGQCLELVSRKGL